MLGEFAYTPAFSLPIRLFLEAKFYTTPCGLDVVRNALGVIPDVNQNSQDRRAQYSAPQTLPVLLCAVLHERIQQGRPRLCTSSSDLSHRPVQCVL